jgi:hypothetical protein
MQIFLSFANGPEDFAPARRINESEFDVFVWNVRNNARSAPTVRGPTTARRP